MSKINRRDLSLGKRGISRERYRELLYFCMQYRQWKEQIEYGLHGVNNDGMPHGTGTSNPTEQQALRNEKLISNCKLIEEAAQKAEPSIWEYILRNVTEGVVYEYMNVPCGRRYFYEARQRFYEILSESK